MLIACFVLLEHTESAAAHQGPAVIPEPVESPVAPSFLPEREAEAALSATLEAFRQNWTHQQYRQGVKALVEVQERFGLSPWTMCALMAEESSMNTQAVSSMGALGLVQMLPTTAPGVSKRNRIPYTDESTLHQVGPSILLGGAFMRELLDEFSGNEVAALTAYNRGAGATRKRFRKHGRYHSDYAWKVLTARRELSGAGTPEPLRVLPETDSFLTFNQISY